MTVTDVNVVVTGIHWMGGGVGSIESAMWQLFQEAEQEILLTVYSITSGADMLFEWMELALSRGVEIKMVVNRPEKLWWDVSNKLRQFANSYPHFHRYNFNSGEDEHVDLHAKVIVVDRRKAIVGSSNLSKRGFLDNYELALTVEGKIATELASTIDRLINNLQ